MYRVVWEMDVEASDDVTSSGEAAEYAWRAMRQMDSIANVFTVTTPRGNRVVVDLHLRTRTPLPESNTRIPYSIA
jgi:hypothetical protein